MATEVAAAGVRSKRGRWLREVWASTIGKKVIAALTGIVLALYVVLHVLGNFKAVQGPGDQGVAPIDTYADWLRDIGEPAIPHEGTLWVLRVVLIVALILHVAAITQLWARNKAARPVDARPAPRIQRSLSARTMMITGVLLLGFVVFHILHFTTGTIEPTEFHQHAVYANLYGAFQEWWLVAIYVGASVLIGYHLRHALWSLVQTMGWDKPNRNPTFRRAATGTAVAVAAGFAFVPVAMFTEILPAP